MVVLGCDKAGTEWLPVISEKLNTMGIENKILYDGTVDGCDYPEAAFMVAEAVAAG
jgi:ribose 5-phosphate isomerase RpiB